MNQAVTIQLYNFFLIYLLLIIVATIMKKSKITQTKLLLIASIRMSVQLTIAGYILMYIIENPSIIFVCTYVFCMCAFAVNRILSVNKDLNKEFRFLITMSLSVCAIAIILFFVGIVIKENIFNPQYTIPISGMIIGNAMTGITLGVKNFMSKIKDSKHQIEVLLNLGAKPKNILKPFVNSALETALLPTINSMLGMGIISLPGMMTGQIISGESPTTAILYQICINVSLCAVVSLSVFLTLNLGYKTLINKDNQFVI